MKDLGETSASSDRLYGAATLGLRGEMAIPAALRRVLAIEQGDRIAIFGSSSHKNIVLATTASFEAVSASQGRHFHGLSRMGAKGQVVIPFKLRQRLGIVAGEKLLLYLETDGTVRAVRADQPDGPTDEPVYCILEGDILPTWSGVKAEPPAKKSEAPEHSPSAQPHLADKLVDELKELQIGIAERSFRKGEIVCLESDPCEAMYVVKAGLIRCYKTSADGKEQTLEIVPPGKPFNEVPLFDGGSNPTSAAALEDSVLYVLPRWDVLALLEHRPETARTIISHFALQVRYLSELVGDLSFRPVIGRVARVLLDYAGCSHRLTHLEIATMAGTAREVVGRSLKLLEGMGFIRLEQNRIAVLDPRALRELIEGA